MFGDKGMKLSVENTNYKAIACQQIPELFLDKIVAKIHFSKYGKIKRFILRPKRLSCTVEYENEEDAKNAYLNAGSFNGIDFFVNFAEHEEAHVQNTEEWVDPEVQAELEAMSTGNRLHVTLRAPTLQKSNVISRIPKNTNSLSKSVGINRQNSPQPEISKIDSTVRQELEAILKAPAFTDEEKYRVLDARDKLIRLTTVRQTDIKKAVATKGTCPDMCPEKERLMREFQRQVSIFEIAEGENSESTISHKKAVKEYSRSSADQEVPLSHELRSESVLQMTMLYLVHRIMGLCDDPKTSLGDWFHFVWDRTRSIRKDITQQELCSLGAVQLVEQCARFHIHCAARLVAEDPSVFDKKINAENLTKCLQTLKYMYHDLRIKGIVCPREAEFRGYVILLNLGDSNFLWEVKQLPEFIQKSVEIKQAIAFYNALQSNNFVRFFSMVKSPDTSYLSACILLGYFTKLRVRAMYAIIKSHNWRKNDVYLPLSYLTSVLGFDDESSAISFFNHYGLQCDVPDKRVLLDRLIKPNVEYAMDRALRFVESKRQFSVGECVFGHSLPPTSLFEHHQPHNSFDNNGMLKIESMAADGHPLMESHAKTPVQLKYQQVQAEKNLISNNENNLFKIPQNISVNPLKQQRKQHLHQEPNIIKEMKESTFDPLIEKDKISPSSGELKFCNNIFTETRTTTPTKDSIFKAHNIKSEQNSNTFFHSIFKPTTEKSLTTLGNIFGDNLINVQPKSNNIFCTAVRETKNIFQQQKYVPKGTFMEVSELQEFQEITEKSDFSSFLIEDDLTTSELKKNRNDTSRKEIDNRNVVRNEVKVNDIKTEEKEALTDLELKNLKDKLKEEEDYERLKINLIEKAEQTAEVIIFALIEEEVLKLAQSELFVSQAINEAADLENDLLITEVVNVFVHDIANEEYALMCYDQLLLNRYFSKWLAFLRKKKEQRKLIENTPLWFTTNTRAQYVEAIKHPCQQENLEMIKRYRLGQPCDLTKFLKNDCDNLFNEYENRLNLFALVGQHLLAKRNFTSSGLLQQRKYFKFLISIPENKEELPGFESLSNKWLMRLIERCQTETGPFLHGIESNVALCVRKLSGITPKNEQGNHMTTEGDHNDGIICLITGTEIDTHSRKRLYNLLKLTKNLKRVPVAIIVYNCNCNKEELATLLGLDGLQEEGLIYSYLVLGCQIKRRNFSFRNLFIKAVDFITKESHLLNANEIQALAMQNALFFIEISLGEELWQKWCASSKRNPIFNKICSFPEHIIGIFHKALDHLLHITQEDFDEMPEFPEDLKEFVPENASSNITLGLEFFPVNWKDKAEKNYIKSFLQSLYLPEIEEKAPANIEELKLWLLNYASKCIKDDDLTTTKASREAIANLVNQINFLRLQNIEISSCVHMVNYLTILKPIVFAHINRMLQRFKESLVNLKVIYLKDDLKNYQTQPWWLNYEPLNLVTIEHGEIPLSLPQTQQQENKQTLISTELIDKIISKAEETSRKAEESISEFKRKKWINNRNSSIHLLPISQLKRTLDDSLYQFELSKKVGQYDTSFVTELTHDIDKSISKLLNQSPLSIRKRKISCLKSPNQYLDIDTVITKATKLIHVVEAGQDKKFKMKKLK